MICMAASPDFDRLESQLAEGDEQMPRPLKIKIFMDTRTSVIEEQINAWLENLGAASIIKTETVVAAVTEKPGAGAGPCIVVTVWYEPPTPDEQRPGFRLA